MICNSWFGDRKSIRPVKISPAVPGGSLEDLLGVDIALSNL